VSGAGISGLVIGAMEAALAIGTWLDARDSRTTTFGCSARAPPAVPRRANG